MSDPDLLRTIIKMLPRRMRYEFATEKMEVFLNYIRKFDDINMERSDARITVNQEKVF